MRTSTAARIVLVLMAVPSAVIAVWSLVAPRSFFDDFPGLGAAWVSPDGPYNEHLLRDYGATLLGLVVLAICAFVWISRPLLLTTGLVWLVAWLPHLGYHALNLDPFPADQHVALVASLVITPVLAVVLLFMANGVAREQATEQSQASIAAR